MITFSENSLTIKEISAFEIDYQDGGMVIKFNGGFLFLGERKKEEKKATDSVEIEKATAISCIIPLSPLPLEIPKEKVLPGRKRKFHSVESIAKKLIEYCRGQKEEVFEIPFAYGGNSTEEHIERAKALQKFVGTSDVPMISESISRLIEKEILEKLRIKNNGSTCVKYKFLNGNKNKISQGTCKKCGGALYTSNTKYQGGCDPLEADTSAITCLQCGNEFYPEEEAA